MKCVLNLQTGKVKREKNDIGRALGRLPQFKLVPKWRWKDQQGIEYRGTRLVDQDGQVK